MWGTDAGLHGYEQPSPKGQNLDPESERAAVRELSLPDDWDYNTTRGLASICREGDAIGKAIKELENAGYMKRRQLRGKDGRITDFEARRQPHRIRAGMSGQKHHL